MASWLCGKCKFFNYARYKNQVCGGASEHGCSTHRVPPGSITRETRTRVEVWANMSTPNETQAIAEAPADVVTYYTNQVHNWNTYWWQWGAWTGATAYGGKTKQTKQQTEI